MAAAEKDQWLQLWDSYKQHLSDNTEILDYMCGQLIAAATERGMTIAAACEVMSECAIATAQEAEEDDES
jgi:hypothetical protein